MLNWGPSWGIVAGQLDDLMACFCSRSACGEMVSSWEEWVDRLSHSGLRYTSMSVSGIKLSAVELVRWSQGSRMRVDLDQMPWDTYVVWTPTFPPAIPPTPLNGLRLWALTSLWRFGIWSIMLALAERRRGESGVDVAGICGWVDDDGVSEEEVAEAAPSDISSIFFIRSDHFVFNMSSSVLSSWFSLRACPRSWRRESIRISRLASCCSKVEICSTYEESYISANHTIPHVRTVTYR